VQELAIVHLAAAIRVDQVEVVLQPVQVPLREAEAVDGVGGEGVREVAEEDVRVLALEPALLEAAPARGEVLPRAQREGGARGGRRSVCAAAAAGERAGVSKGRQAGSSSSGRRRQVIFGTQYLQHGAARGSFLARHHCGNPVCAYGLWGERKSKPDGIGVAAIL